MASYLLDWTEKAHPKVLDLYLYSFDASLHVQFPFVFGRWFAQYPIFALMSFSIYIGLPIAIGLTYAGCLMRDRKNALSALVALLIAGPVGILFYNLVPALGPAHIFLQGFPWKPLSYAQVSRLFWSRLRLLARATPFLRCTQPGPFWCFGTRAISRSARESSPEFSFSLRCARL